MAMEAISRVTSASTANASVSKTESIQAVSDAASSGQLKDSLAAQSQTVTQVQKSSEDKSMDKKDDDNVTLGDLKEISKAINKNTIAEFGYYEPAHRMTITIKDKQTGDVIKEIPSEKMLKAFTKACELAGILVDEKR